MFTYIKVVKSAKQPHCYCLDIVNTFILLLSLDQDHVIKTSDRIGPPNKAGNTRMFNFESNVRSDKLIWNNQR